MARNGRDKLVFLVDRSGAKRDPSPLFTFGDSLRRKGRDEPIVSRRLVSLRQDPSPSKGQRDESYYLAEGAEPIIATNDGLPCEMRKKRVNYKKVTIRDVAQFGSAPVLGTGGRRFKSCHPYPNSVFLFYLKRGGKESSEGD